MYILKVLDKPVDSWVFFLPALKAGLLFSVTAKLL